MYYFQNGSFDASIPGYTGNGLLYNVATKDITANGLLNMHLRLKPIELLSNGRVSHNVESNTMNVEMSQAISLGLPDEIWQAIGLMISFRNWI